jgi:hypothetical protein
MKNMLAEILDKLTEMEANQDELRQDQEERWRVAERLLTDRRPSWWRRVVGDNLFGRLKDRSATQVR